MFESGVPTARTLSDCAALSDLNGSRDNGPLLNRVGRIAIQLFDAANAPSPSTAAGSELAGIECQICPSSVSRTSKCSFPESSEIGSPSTTPCVGSQKAIESKNPLGLVFLNCSDQCLPPSPVW